MTFDPRLMGTEYDGPPDPFRAPGTDDEAWTNGYFEGAARGMNDGYRRGLRHHYLAVAVGFAIAFLLGAGLTWAARVDAGTIGGDHETAPTLDNGGSDATSQPRLDCDVAPDADPTLRLSVPDVAERPAVLPQSGGLADVAAGDPARACARAAAGDVREPTAQPEPAPLAPSPKGYESTAIYGGLATWYDDGDGMYAAVPTYRFGDPRYPVQVCHEDRCVIVTVRDFCACPGARVIDLGPDAFVRLAPLARGVIPVTVESILPPATDSR